MRTIPDMGLAYVATPYSKYHLGIEKAFMHASALTGRLLREGVKAYSPIAHTHPIAVHGNIDPYAHDVWLPFDEAMMTKSDSLLIATMPGWQDSKGVQHEVEFFNRLSKPVWYLDPYTLEVAKQ